MFPADGNGSYRLTESSNKLLLLCGVSIPLQVAMLQKLLILDWTAFNKVSVN